jgi:hypothetical protein
MPGVTQGPWTDIFALASVLYAAISGRRTVAAVERLLNDQLPPLSTVAAGRCGNAFLAAVDHALAIHPKDRPQSIADFRMLLTADDTQAIDLLELEALGLKTGDETVLLTDIDPTRAAPPPRSPTPSPAPRPPAQPVPAPQVPAPGRLPPEAAPAIAPPPEPALPPPPAPARRGLLLGVLGLAGLATAAWLGSRWASAPTPEAASPTPAPAPTPVPAPDAAAVASQPAATPPAPTPAPTPAPATLAPAPVAPPASAPATVTAAPATAASRPRAQTPAPAPTAARGARCSDILQKASLEPLSASETAYLKKECR